MKLRSKAGFTLVELLVALGVTSLIITMLVAITASALDGFRASRNTVNSSREAKSALQALSRDLESIVYRKNNSFEWLWAANDQENPGPAGSESPNASRLVFFTTATDRYDGEIGGTKDLGGDVSTVGYRLLYRDPVSDSENNEFATFILYRQLIDPKETFDELLGQEDLQQAYQAFENNESDAENFVCENIYQFSLSFTVEYTPEGADRTTTQRIYVLDSGANDAVEDLRLHGQGIARNGLDPGDSAEDRGRIISADVSVTVINDSALEVLRQGGLQEDRRRRLIEENSTHYAQTIILPSA